ncbi:MAG: ComEC/Rec2 family competence protein, partial [Acidimicrobiales bacterium]
ALLASALGARAWAGLDGAEVGPFTGVVTLVSDPEPMAGATRADVAVDGRRYEVWARGPAAARLSELLAGERVELIGRVQRPPPSGLPPWVSRRHVAARLAIERVGRVLPGVPLAALANGLRRTLVDGTGSLSEDSRALFSGLVLGDDRDQSPVVEDDFRAAGLVHLLAVSGQNVAFVLVLVGPLLQRLGLRLRLVAGITAIAFFAVVWRFEPSVLRAAAMASVGSVADALGREASGLRLLALAVTGLVLVDPLLVASVGFQLSVGASLGIVTLARRLGDLLPGPSWLARPLGVTMAAQLGVAPVLVPVFGGLPVASLPANLLAVPAAGPLMVWGMTGGLVAGIAAHLPGGHAGAAVAAALHLPSQMLLGWIGGVAGVCGSLPLGELRAGHIVVLALAAGLGLVAGQSARNRGKRWSSRAPVLAGVLAIGALVTPALALRSAPPLHRGDGVVQVWRRGDTVVVAMEPTASAPAVLEALRRQGIRRIDVLAVRARTAQAGSVAGSVTQRYHPAIVLAPAGAGLPFASTPPDGTVLTAGAPGDELVVVVTLAGGRLDVLVESAAARARSPPRRREARLNLAW